VFLTFYSASAHPHAAEKTFLPFTARDAAPMNFFDWHA
jgi:hypothetical protein